MSNAKYKANELVEKFNIISCPANGMYSMTDYQSIRCAIIAVDEIIFILQNVYYNYNLGGELDYYKEVKRHLEEML